MKILVTGGCGYIGSHTCCELLDHGYDIAIIDNLVNSKRDVIEKIEKITEKKVSFYEGDVRDATLLRKIFKSEKIEAVIHFAGLKAVGESVSMPLEYYHNNLLSTITLCQVMGEFKCKNLVFSSSATVYGNPKKLPIQENFPLSATNPYGRTKLFIEQILQDLAISDSSWNIAILRYFNPIGAHESGLLGEDPNGIPNNLMPYIVKVANHELDCLSVFGNDYHTKDGTGVRDYIHVVDLAAGHVAAIEKITSKDGVHIYNLGTGNGISVLELIHTFSKVNQIKVNYRISKRRPGDIDACYADCTKAEKEMGWKAKKTVEDMCRDSYQFCLKNKGK